MSDAVAAHAASPDAVSSNGVSTNAGLADGLLELLNDELSLDEMERNHN